jgi:hypothetical protein
MSQGWEITPYLRGPASTYDPEYPQVSKSMILEFYRKYWDDPVCSEKVEMEMKKYYVPLKYEMYNILEKLKLQKKPLLDSLIKRTKIFAQIIIDTNKNIVTDSKLQYENHNNLLKYFEKHLEDLIKYWTLIIDNNNTNENNANDDNEEIELLNDGLKILNELTIRVLWYKNLKEWEKIISLD